MREMIQANIDAFDSLHSQLEMRANLTAPSGKRFIRTDTEEKEWIKNAKLIEVLKVLPNAKAVIIEFNEERYISLIGLNIDISQFDESIIELAEVNAGLLTVLLSERLIELSESSSSLEFYDNIMFQHQDESYIGHDYNDLLFFLETIFVFKLPFGSVLKKSSVNRILCYIFSKDPKRVILNFEQDILDTISELSLVGSDKISFTLILNSLLSTTYKHAFLELYRLIERLFPISYLKDFHSIAKSSLTFLEFSSTLENITSWRPKEDDAIEKIFKNTKDSTKSHFSEFLKSSSTLGSYSEHSYFYKLRNSIVHYRANHVEFQLTDHQWNLLLHGTIYLIDEHYSINQLILN